MGISVVVISMLRTPSCNYRMYYHFTLNHSIRLQSFPWLSHGTGTSFECNGG